MKIAVPVSKGKLCLHFGHCAEFAVLEIDGDKKTVTARQNLIPPPHEPGVLPRWLAENGVTLVIAGGMGVRAQDIFKQNGIGVVTGAPSVAPEVVVDDYLKDCLQTGENSCSH